MDLHIAVLPSLVNLAGVTQATDRYAEVGKIYRRILSIRWGTLDVTDVGADLRVHFGMGDAERADRLEVRWPSGSVDTIDNIQANQILTVREGKGVIDRQPLVK